MSGSSNSFVSLHTTAVTVLAGIGAGYLIGLLTAKLLSRGRGVTPPVRTRPLIFQSLQVDLLTSAITNLASEVGSLRNAVSEIRHHLGRRSRESGILGAAESISDFVSAQGDDHDSDGEFFDIEDRENVEVDETPSTPNMDYLDNVAKETMEREDVCDSLITELNGLLETSPDNPGLLWRLSRSLVHLSMHYQFKGDSEEEKELLAKASATAKKALELDDSVWQSHKWYAISIGSLTKYESTQKKITSGHVYKEHIDTAININPDDPNLYYLRGRLSFEIASLSWLEKTAAAALYATPLQATFAESLEDFMQVEDLNPGVWKANLLMIAKCHIKLGDIPTAVEWLHKSFQLKVINTEDKTSHKELEELLATYDL